ncbi:phage integrase N-terminal SAM-like domain-containing protein [Salinicola endophyticus]|uniref:Phage integrase N-terminal SAM-like domain-containing protein n=1 Tax=Salinicola endophyticus TaxID=1949083 RepID=A0AB74UCI0_9GAMM
MDRVKAIIRVKRHSPPTEKTSCYWTRYFIRFHGLRHPASMGAPEVKALLEHLALDRYVMAATPLTCRLASRVTNMPFAGYSQIQRAKTIQR